MSPHLYDVFFCIAEAIVSKKQAFKDLRNIAHVERVVNSCWNRLELGFCSLKQQNGSLSQRLGVVFDVLCKRAELDICNRLVNLHHAVEVEFSVVNHMELRKDAI